jgi:hypothetical protein
MSRSRLIYTAIAAVLMFAASIAPAPATTQSSGLVTIYSPLGAKCADIGPTTRCCTDTGYCCTWSGDGSPICY